MLNISMLVLNTFINDARVHKEASTLASAGYTVNVIALWQPGLDKVENRCGYRVFRIPLSSRALQNRLLSPLIKYIEYAWRVWKLSHRIPAHIYHANDGNTLPIAWMIAKKNNAKLIYDAHELETGRNFGNSSLSRIYRIVWSFPEKLLIHKVDAVITVNRLIADELARLYKIHVPFVIMNCPVLDLVSNTNLIRQELNIPDDMKILIYQGRITSGRGLESFFVAIQQLNHTVGVVLGDGPLLQAYRDRVRSGEWQRIYLLGMINMTVLPTYTASADLGVVLIQDTCLSYRLSLPNKLFEYLHAGLPVICSDLPAMATIVKEYQVGELVNPDDPVSIARGIKITLGDLTRYKTLKANTHKASEVYNWQNEGKKLIEIYKNFAPN
jgi:glycosyltransferase involved in cell wall biosynthesis